MPLHEYVDLAADGMFVKADTPTVPVDSSNIPGNLSGERGSSWPEHRIFEWQDENEIYLRGPVEDFEIESMLKLDGKARAVEQVLTLPVRGAKWVVDDNDAGKPVMDYVTDLLEKPADQGGMASTMGQIIAQATAACLYRSACFEKVFDLDPQTGQVIYSKLAYRPPTTCYLARNVKSANLDGFLQWTWLDAFQYQRVFIPAAKSFIYLHGTHRDPLMGSTDMDVVYRSFITKQKLRFLWGAYCENQVIPKLKGQVKTADPQAADNLARRGATLRAGGIIGLTSNEDINPIGGDSAGGGAVFQQAIAYCDEEMYASILANFLGLATASGVRGGGSFALSLSQTDFYLQSRQAVLSELAEQITHQVIAPMVRWNFGKQVPVPRFRFVSLAPTSNTMEAILQMVAALAIVPTKPGSPAPVPSEFIEAATSAAAGMLGFDTGKIHDAITARAQQLSDSYAGRDTTLDAAADVTAGLVAQQGAVNGLQPPANPVPGRPASPIRPATPAAAR